MNSLFVKLTKEQIITLNTMLVCVAIDDYSAIKTEAFKRKAVDISTQLLRAQATINEPVQQEQEECDEEYLEDEQSSKYDFLPDQFFDTYNSVVEQENSGAKINRDNEGLRFLKGKAGQIGVQYWDNYIELSRCDASFFINNKDANNIYDVLEDMREIIAAGTIHKNKKGELTKLASNIFKEYNAYVRCGFIKIDLESEKETVPPGINKYTMIFSEDVLNGKPTNLDYFQLIKEADGKTIKIPFKTMEQIIIFIEFLRDRLER